MNSFLISLFIYSLVIMLLLVIFLLMSEKNTSFHSKMLYETGVEMTKFIRPPFSIQFFLIGLIFILFDLEVIFLMGLFFSLTDSIFTLVFLFILLLIYVLFIYEWKFNKLFWFK